jgi:NAD(P)H-dependent FMN reductase
MNERPIALLSLCGSRRTGSLNLRLAARAAAIARSLGASVTEVDLRALALPIYDGDVEALGQPDGARELRRLFATHDGVLFTSPEYNGFVSPLLVNALDWASRPKAEGGLPDGLAAMNGTVAGLISASPSAHGGARGLMALRLLLTATLGFLVVTPALSVPRASQAFDEEGKLADPMHEATLSRTVQAVMDTALALRRH